MIFCLNVLVEDPKHTLKNSSIFFKVENRWIIPYQKRKENRWITTMEKEHKKTCSMPTLKNSATFAASCCCSKEDWLPCQVKIVEPDWRTKHSAEFNDVATWIRIA